MKALIFTYDFLFKKKSSFLEVIIMFIFISKLDRLMEVDASINSFILTTLAFFFILSFMWFTDGFLRKTKDLYFYKQKDSNGDRHD